MAAFEGHDEIVAALINSGSNINARRQRRHHGPHTGGSPLPVLTDRLGDVLSNLFHRAGAGSSGESPGNGPILHSLEDDRARGLVDESEQAVSAGLAGAEAYEVALRLAPPLILGDDAGKNKGRGILAIGLDPALGDSGCVVGDERREFRFVIKLAREITEDGVGAFWLQGLLAFDEKIRDLENFILPKLLHAFRLLVGLS